jgi:hypothetical protein
MPDGGLLPSGFVFTAKAQSRRSASSFGFIESVGSA